MERKGKNLTNSWCVCSGLIKGSVDDIQHRTGALISGLSHSFIYLFISLTLLGSGLVELDGYLSCQNRFGGNAPPLNVGTRGIWAFCWGISSRCALRVPYARRFAKGNIDPTAFRPSTHQQSQAYCGDLAATVLLPRWLQQESVNKVMPAAWFRYAIW